MRVLLFWELRSIKITYKIICISKLVFFLCFYGKVAEAVRSQHKIRALIKGIGGGWRVTWML